MKRGKKAKGGIMYKVYDCVFKKIKIMLAWAFTLSERTHKTLFATVASGERNWKPKIKNGSNPHFSWSTF